MSIIISGRCLLNMVQENTKIRLVSYINEKVKRKKRISSHIPEFVSIVWVSTHLYGHFYTSICVPCHGFHVRTTPHSATTLLYHPLQAPWFQYALLSHSETVTLSRHRSSPSSSFGVVRGPLAKRSPLELTELLTSSFDANYDSAMTERSPLTE